MLVLLLLVHHALGDDSPKQPTTYDRRDISSCPDEGYFFEQELQDLQVSQHPGLCYLCFCEGSSGAICWEHQPSGCNDSTHHHVGRRSLILNPKTFSYDGNDTTISKNTLEQEECDQVGKVFNLDCPPEDWCAGCTACVCLDSGKWKCRTLQACTDERLMKKIVKRNLYRFLTSGSEKNYTSMKAIFHKSKRDRMIKVQHEKEVSIPEEVYTKNKERITIQHTKEILEQKEISAKMKKDRKEGRIVERRTERIVEVMEEVTTHKSTTHSKLCKHSNLHNYKTNKASKGNKVKVNLFKDNKNNTLRKEMSQTKMLFMNTKQNKKMTKHQTKLPNKPLQETHKLSVRHISIHSDKHKSRITKRHNSKTYLKNISEKNNKVKQEKLFFKLAYSDDSKGRLARRKRNTEAEVTADDIVTLSNETDSDLYIAVPEIQSNQAASNEKERNTTTHYFAYKLVDPKKDAKKTRAVKDLYFPFIDGLDSVINKLNEINNLSEQQGTTSDTDALLNQFETLHGIEDANLVAHLDRTKLNFTKNKKLARKDIVRKLKMKSGIYKTLKSKDYKKNFTDSEDVELRQYILKVMNLFRSEGNGHMMLLNYKRLNALKFLRELLKDMFYKKHYNKSQKNNDKSIIDLLCNNFGPCFVKEENNATINSNTKVLYMEVIKMLRTVKIIRSLLKHIEKPGSCAGKPEFNCDILTLTTVMKKGYEKRARTHEEKVLINSVKQNTKSFIRSVEHFVVIFNNLLSIVSKHETVTEEDTIPESSNNSTKHLFKKLKQLIAMYKLSENHFLKSIVAAIPAENKTQTTKIKKTDLSPAYTQNIMTKLKKLKNLAEAVITQNKQRSKRSLLDYDVDVVEYLLNVMEYIVKQTIPRNQVNDGIDLLLNAIERTSNEISPKKKKYIYPISAPQRTTTTKTKTNIFRRIQYNADIHEMEPDYQTELPNKYVTKQFRLTKADRRYTTPYPINFLVHSDDLNQKGDTDTLPAVINKKHLKTLKQYAGRGKRPLLRGYDELKSNYVPMRSTTMSIFNFPADRLEFNHNSVDYIDDVPDGSNNTASSTPIIQTDLIHRSFKPVFNEIEKDSSSEEDIQVGEKIGEDSFSSSKEEEK